MIKDIVVHLTGSEEDAVRLAYAAPIARTLDAHLTGLQVHNLPEVIAITDPTGSAFLQELLKESHKRADAVAESLKARLAQIGLPHELRRLDVYPGRAGAALAAEARTSDLFLGTRPYGDPTKQERIEETVLFRSGRGCLLLPPGGTPPKSYGTIFVAWKDTREAARAVAEALPFLQRAQQVVVGLVEEEGASEQYRIAAGADIGRYLSRHGVSAEIRRIAGWAYAGEALLNEANQLLADMIVMGGYGHSRFREWVLGGATRHILTHATVPVLIAH
ncbi:MAG TPA: universal stress protein [Alphaproteobacteria bacterium]|nr:universal stress protein [Alphaproteobacteria bacterium]